MRPLSGHACSASSQMSLVPHHTHLLWRVPEFRRCAKWSCSQLLTAALAPETNSPSTEKLGPKRTNLPPGMPAWKQKRWEKPRAPPTKPQEDLPEVPIVRTGAKGSSTFFTADSFKQVGASEEMIAALGSIGITRPSHVQAAAYKALRSGPQHMVVADHAGSGKTLAYLAPLVQQLREEEAQAGESLTRPRRPRVIVVAPTEELCAQVLRVARALGRAARFRSTAVTGGHAWRPQKEALREGVDLLVATPGRLAEHIKEGNVELEFCSSVVLDEVDILLGSGSAFSEEVVALRDSCPATTRFVLVTATLPEHTFGELQERFPGIKAAMGPGLHRTAPGAVEELVDCSGGDEINEETGFLRKADALQRVLAKHGAARAIVFCNKIATCRRVENLLNRKGAGGENAAASLEVLAHHAAIADDIRQANLQRFLQPPGDSRMVLICTDRASRGLDSTHVEHVVLFDFPRDPSEYVRRVGRTARGAGGSGTVSILVLGRQVGLAKAIMGRNEKGLPIHSVPVPLRTRDKYDESPRGPGPDRRRTGERRDGSDQGAVSKSRGRSVERESRGPPLQSQGRGR